MKLGRHSVVAGGNELNATIGNFSSIGEDCYTHHADNHGVIGSPLLVSTFSFGNWLGSWPGDGCAKGEIRIDHDVWIGRNVKILTGVHIYSGAIVAAHSVVTKDVPPYAVVAGNPSRIKKFRFAPETIQRLLEIAWWDWPDKLIKERLTVMQDVNEFVRRFGKESA